ncbi:uncharacterized protein LOC126820906 [Patella vulgata]|uniref:uncharacterized protein LOC126820906 n=1 Tax=Patella vulgata TaxID=6465 RepID=UPI0021803096|nr:uncharacterized protein LOC126820906 [Patella vulgata]
MNSHKQFQGRQSRKLPHVPRGKKNHVFWPTYRGAVEWMRKHQEILDTATGLLEIYPNIIRDYSLDSFWNFIKPYVNRYTEDTRSQTDLGVPTKPKPSYRNSSVVLPKIKPNVPLISITKESDTDEENEMIIAIANSYNKTMRIYICGDFDQETFYPSPSLVEHMCSFSYVCHNTINKQCYESLCEADSFIFLLSDKSLTDSDCCQNLFRAWSLDIPTVFVRKTGYKLPSPLPEGFLDQVLKSDELNEVPRKAPFYRRSTTPYHNVSLPPNSLTSIPRSVSASTSYDLKSSNANFGFQTSFKSSDLMLKLLNGYRNSIIYDERSPLSSILEIKSCLNRRVDMPASPRQPVSPPQPDQFLSIPSQMGSSLGITPHYITPPTFIHIPSPSTQSLRVDTDDFSIASSLNASRSTSPTHSVRNDIYRNDSHSTSSIHLNVPNIEQDLDSGVHSPVEKETFYIVYPDHQATSSGSSPKIVKWPPDEPEMLVSPLSPESSAMDSPLTFNDIDLSTEVNYDLFSPDSSLNAD